MAHVLKLQTLKFSTAIWAPSEVLASGFSGICPIGANLEKGYENAR